MKIYHSVEANIVIPMKLKEIHRQKLYNAIREIIILDRFYKDEFESLDDKTLDAVNRIINNIIIKSINKVYQLLQEDKMPLINITALFDANQDFIENPYGLFVQKVEVEIAGEVSKE